MMTIKNKILAILLAVSFNAFAAAWTGSNSEPENMKKIDGKAFYVITTADELAWFAVQVNSGRTAINAVLGNDIVFGANNSSTCTAKWTPIGNSTSIQFAGVLDGAGHTIYGLYTNEISLAGVVGVLGKDGIVKNLNTAVGNINGTLRSGGIVAHNVGLVQNVKNGNVVNANASSVYAGGVAGHNEGTIENCSNSGSVKSISNSIAEGKGARAGGIAGHNTGNIRNCINNGGIRAEGEAGYSKSYSGGIVGYNESLIFASKNNGVVSSIKAYCGGIAAFSSEIINDCINNGEVRKAYSSGAGGIVQNGKAENTIDIPNLICWLNGEEVQWTKENMQKDQFAWILNTSNGTKENSGVWSRNGDYPIFANESNHAIYKVIFNDEGVTTNRYTNNKGLATFPDDPEPAEGYIFTGWYNTSDVRVRPVTIFSDDQTVNAVYADASNVFWTINFYNTDAKSTLLETKSYQHGSVVAYEGETPTRENTAQYIYTFKGWDVELTNAVEDFDYHAVYDSTVRSYTIVFNNFDGTKIESVAFEYGKMPSCSKTPTRVATAEWKWTHKGWKPALDYVTGGATYVATYDSSKVEYKVTFMNGVDVIDEQIVPYGEAAVSPTNVTREGYKFVGWNTTFSKITENLTVKALFEELTTYIVKVVGLNGEKIDSVKVEENGTYILPTAPKKEGYTFDAYYNGEKKIGTAGNEVSVTENITITAKYTKNPESSSSGVPKSSSSSAPKSSSSAKSSSSVKASSSSGVVVSSSSKQSSSSVRSSSSSVKSSSSSAKTSIAMKNITPRFNVTVGFHSVQISGAKVGTSYALLDMQGRVLRRGRVESANFNIAVPNAGQYFVGIDNQIRRVNVK